MMARVRCGFLLALSSLLLGLWGCQGKPEEVRIGLIGMMSGANQANGQTMRDAAALAVREAGERGGLLFAGVRHPLRLIVEDDHNRPEAALEAARKLVYKDRVAALVGPQFSANAIPVARFADSIGVVMVAPLSTNPETTVGKRYVFRIPYLDTFQGKVLGRFAREELHARTAAALYDVAGDYNRTLAEVFRDTFETDGGKVTAFETYTTDQSTDFTAQLRRIALQKPDVLFLPNYSAEARRQGDQARAMGIRAVLLGGDGWDPGSFASDPAFEGSFETRHWDPSQEGRKTRSFLQAFQSAYNRVPDDVAATTYDAVSLLCAAIEKAGGVKPDDVRSSILSMADFEGVTGSIAYAGTGDPIKSALILQLKGGKGSVHAIIKP
jgi:branched-chain amino acid transport system substrate-binding protein